VATAAQLQLTAFLGRLNTNTLSAPDQALLTQALTSIIASWGFGGSGALPDATSSGGQSDESNAREWMALLYAIAEGFGGSGGGGGGGGVFVVPASWLVPAWFIDPVAGNDANNGTTALTPLKTWAQLVFLWGTNAPILAQNTAITFLSSQPDATDPVVWRPVLKQGASAVIIGTAPTVVASVVLAGVVAKNRATGQLLNATLGALAAPGQMLRNTTAGKTSRAWVYKLVAGTTFGISAPLVPVALPVAAMPAQVNTWANGDTVDILSLVNVAIAEVSPIVADDSAGHTNGVTIYGLNLMNPPGAGAFTATVLGFNTSVWECGSTRVLTFAGRNASGLRVQQAIGNVGNLAGVAGDGRGGPRAFVGGMFASDAAHLVSLSTSWEGELSFDGDFIFGRAAVLVGPAGGTPLPTLQLGAVYLEPGITMQLSGTVNAAILDYGLTAIWGAAGSVLNVIGKSKLVYPAGAGAAAACFLSAGLAGGTPLQLGGSTTGHSVIAGAPDVFNGGITILPASLDAVAGAAGFGGNAFTPGGSSIQNFN
jgi:hypothetical protein